MTVAQTPEDLVRHLEEQLAFLRASSESFDKGFLGEAKRLAATMRVLVHDKGRSTSLLASLGIKDKLRFYDKYAGKSRSPKAVYFGVLTGFGSNGVIYAADLSERKAQSDFATWWSGVAIQQGGHCHSRRDIVLSIANKDGGHHVDLILDARYAALSRGFASHWRMLTAEGEKGGAQSGPELHVVRQCAHEVELTLIRQAPQLLGVTKLG